MKRKLLLLSLASSIFAGNASAKISAADTSAPMRTRLYWATNNDGGIFSTAFIKTTTPAIGSVPATTSNSMGTLRFSYVLNIGASYNIDFNKNVGVFVGASIRNIGFISKNAGVTTKIRTYNIGIPVGIKFGNMRPRRAYGFAGGGIDLPFHFKQKTFTDRSSKNKTTDWFSDRTPVIMPFVFAGVAINKGITIKLQYYPGNYVNPDFIMNTTAGPVKPYANTEAHVLMLSLGYSAPFRAHRDMMKKKVESLEVKG